MGQECTTAEEAASITRTSLRDLWPFCPCPVYLLLLLWCTSFVAPWPLLSREAYEQVYFTHSFFCHNSMKSIPSSMAWRQSGTSSTFFLMTYHSANAGRTRAQCD